MASRSGWVNVAFIVLFALMVASWVIMLGGVGAAQSSCTKILDKRTVTLERRLALEDTLGEVGRRVLSSGRQLLASNSETCSNQFSLIWWTVWFQFVCIGLGVVVSVSTTLQQRFGLTVTLFFVVSTTILMGTAKTANDAVFNNKDSTVTELENYTAASRAALAGTVMLMICNFVFIVLSTDSYGSNAPALALPTHNNTPPPAANSKAFSDMSAAAPAAAVAATLSGASSATPAAHAHAAAGAPYSGTPSYSPAVSPAPPTYPSPASYAQPPPQQQVYQQPPPPPQPVVTEPQDANRY